MLPMARPASIVSAPAVCWELVLTASSQCGFRNGIDTNSLEVKNLYVDFRIPQVPLGNRWQIGGIPANVTPLHPYLLYTMDAGGGSVKLDFTDEVSLLLHYIQLEEDLDRFQGSTKLGEDYIAGATLMLRPIPGLDLHLLGIFGHLQAPFGPTSSHWCGPIQWDHRRCDECHHGRPLLHRL